MEAAWQLGEQSAGSILALPGSVLLCETCTTVPDGLINGITAPPPPLKPLSADINRVIVDCVHTSICLLLISNNYELRITQNYKEKTLIKVSVRFIEYLQCANH